MHENLKTQKDRAFMLFTKAYLYRTNTRKKWLSLSDEEKQRKGLKWDCPKMFIVSNGEISEEDVYKHIKDCPETYNYIDGINGDFNPKWVKSTDCVLYNSNPLTEYDFKVILNNFGIRLIHFINVKR